ncbi:hypothetical protein VNO78_11721 [Psophocarpus tetragonolobus]|uniref:Uncharacterized protein n=1 Tax=Psophocarpus tetragonolobus TaxID=3891 RepID=A0AAN9SMA7_PSOTE
MTKDVDRRLTLRASLGLSDPVKYHGQIRILHEYDLDGQGAFWADTDEADLCVVSRFDYAALVRNLDLFGSKVICDSTEF